jgi:hypothetical protein
MRLNLAASSVDSVEKGTLATVPPLLTCRKSQTPLEGNLTRSTF